MIAGDALNLDRLKGPSIFPRKREQQSYALFTSLSCSNNLIG